MCWNKFKTGHRCYKCNCSKGETFIQNFLDKIGLKYDIQYRDPDVENISPHLPFEQFV